MRYPNKFLFGSNITYRLEESRSGHLDQISTPHREESLQMDIQQRQTFALGWGSLALINAGLAQGKNRSGFNWFLLSLLFGPFATFMLVAFFPKLTRFDE